MRNSSDGSLTALRGAVRQGFAQIDEGSVVPAKMVFAKAEERIAAVERGPTGMSEARFSENAEADFLVLENELRPLFEPLFEP